MSILLKSFLFAFGAIFVEIENKSDFGCSFSFGFCFNICGRFLLNNLTLVENNSCNELSFLQLITRFRNAFQQSAQNGQLSIILSKFRHLQNLKRVLELAHAQVFSNKMFLNSLLHSLQNYKFSPRHFGLTIVVHMKIFELLN